MQSLTMKMLQRIVIKSAAQKHLQHCQTKDSIILIILLKSKTALELIPDLENSLYRNGNLVVHLKCSTVLTNAAIIKVISKLVAIHPSSSFQQLLEKE